MTGAEGHQGRNWNQQNYLFIKQKYAVKIFNPASSGFIASMF